MTARIFSPDLAALITATLLAPMIPALAPIAQALPNPSTQVATVDQGDVIYNVDTGQECAVGWLKDGYAFTAGQCGTDGDYFRDVDYNYLGMFETRYDPDTHRNDFGWIKLDLEVGEGANRYELAQEDPERGTTLRVEGRDNYWYRTAYAGADGTTGVLRGRLPDGEVPLGKPVYTYDDELVGLYSGEVDGRSVFTRPDRIAESPIPVDPEYVATRSGDAQHAEVREFGPDVGVGVVVDTQRPARVDQGMRLINPGKGQCTIGYIADGVVYSSGHCGSEGDEIWLGDDAGYRLERIGTYSTTYQEDESLPEDDRVKLRNDHGFIKVDSPWVTPGENGFSGDGIVPFNDIVPGFEVCAYGQTTKPRIRCGVVKGVDGADIVMGESVDGEPGDSGGPVWAKDGSGLVGIYSGGTVDGSVATASYPYAQTDNNNEISIDYDAILRAFALGVPYYSLFPLYETYLGLRVGEISIPKQAINQGDYLYDWSGNPVCRVGYVKGNRLYFASDCGHMYLHTQVGREVTVVEGDTYTSYRAETSTLSGTYWADGKNMAEADRMVPWDEIMPGDEICTSGPSSGQVSGQASGDKACTTLLGLDGPRLILKEPFEGDYAIPGGPLWVPGKGFAGVLTKSRDDWGQGMRIDMVYDPNGGNVNTNEAVRAYELGEPFYQKTTTMWADEELNPTERVVWPERTFTAGERLYNYRGDYNGELHSDAVCEIARVEDGHLVVSSECDGYVYTRLGDFVGRTVNASDAGDQVATIEVTGNFMSAGENTDVPIVAWEDLTPGTQVCAADACSTFAGYDGSRLVLTDPLPGVLPGAALRIPGKGLVGVYHRDGIGSRPDMIESNTTADSNAAKIRAAFANGERFYAHNDATFWSHTSGPGEPVPFPIRRIDEGMLLYDDASNPTCHVGRVDKQTLYVSTNCGAPGTALYTAAGEFVGTVKAAPGKGAATVEVEGRRLTAGSNEHGAFAAWDALTHGDTLCTTSGCGEFIGLDGAQIIHTAPSPAHPGAALWNPEKGFVGVVDADGVGSRIDMVTTNAAEGAVELATRAHRLGFAFFQRSEARFWDGSNLGDPVPFPTHPALNQGALLYDDTNTAVCVAGFVDKQTLFTSSECGAAGTTLYTAHGEPLGSLTVPAEDTTARNKFGYVRLNNPYVPVGRNAVTGDAIVAWDAVEPGEKACTSGAGAGGAGAGGERCGTYLGHDGSMVLLSDEAKPDGTVALGGPVWVPGKGFLAVYAGEVSAGGGDDGDGADGADGVGAVQTGARIDMITRGNQPLNVAEVLRAFENKERYYQKATANYFSVDKPNGDRVPFHVKHSPAPGGGSALSSASDSGSGSSTGGIVAAIVVPLLLLGLGFLATQVVDLTKFGLPPVPKVLPL